MYGDQLQKNIIVQQCEQYMANNKQSKLNIFVTIKTPDAKSYNFTIDPNITINEFKHNITNNLNNFEPKKLIYCGNFVYDYQTINSINLKPTDSMIAMLENKQNSLSPLSVVAIKFQTSNDQQILRTLCELYNVRIQIFKYNNNTQTLFVSDCYGEHEKTQMLPLILLYQQSETVYGVLMDKNSFHKRPLKLVVEETDVIIRDINRNINQDNIFPKQSSSPKRKLDQRQDIESDSPKKKRKLSVVNDVGFDHKNLKEKYLSIKRLNGANVNELNSFKQQNGILHAQIDSLRQLNVLKVEELNEYKNKNEILEKTMDEMKSKLNLKIETATPDTENICSMNLDGLNQLKTICQNKIKLIEEAEKELIDNTYKCVACMDRPKNISFVDGCSHVTLCDKCEALLQTKCCPICQQPYKNVRIMNF